VGLIRAQGLILSRRLQDEAARAALAVVRPLDLYHPLPDPPLKVRHLCGLTTETYVRVIHPIQVSSHGELQLRRLTQVARSHGLDADLPTAAVVSLVPQELRAEPLVGTLDPGTVREVAGILGGSGVETQAFFYYWEGLGALPDGEPHVYEGAVAGGSRATVQSPSPTFQSPTIWWARDTSWFVATHTDATSTYVGGPPALKDALLESDAFDAFEAGPDTRVDDWTERHR
jgi:hypothetical protein